jgi:glycosyltransferase involved in cell wall biosynthesis
MQKNSLTLCMIARDEEETIGRTLKSALAVVDEVVVVDTGSTDNTRLIVEGYGARVIDFPWCEDFSAARNAGLAAAYGDWILILDADEVLESIRPIEMGRLLADESAIAYYARIRNEIDGRATTVYDKVRIFRNHPEIRYRFPIHEQITPAIASVAMRTGGRFLASPVQVIHHGSVERAEKGKKARNQRLLHRAIDQYPDEPYFHYQIACEGSVHLEEQLLPVKGFDEILHELERGSQLVAEMPRDRREHLGYGADLFGRYASALLTAGRHEEALAACGQGESFFGDASLLRFTSGRALLELSRDSGDDSQAQELRSKARDRMESMMSPGESLEPAPISDAYFEVYPLRYLGEIALADGDLAGARTFFQRALEVDPDYTGPLCGLARVAEAEGRHKEALQIYLKALTLNEDEFDAWIGGAQLLIGIGFTDNARSWLEKLATFLPEHPRVKELLEATRPVYAAETTAGD